MPKSSHQALIETGLRHQRAGRLNNAAKTYREVLAEDPSQPDALHLMGVIAHELGNFDDAVELIAESLRHQPENASAINNLAGVLKDQGRLPEALEFYDAAVAAAPDQAYIHSNRGNVLKDLGRPEEALSSYQRALQLDPRSPAAHLNCGALFKDQGQLDTASDYYRRALELNPNSHEALSNLGVVLRERGRVTEAIDCLEQALKLQPNSDAACTNLGIALKDAGRLDEALAWHCRALELNPRSAFAFNNLGSFLKDQGRFGEALSCFEKAIENQPNYYLAHNNRGSALCEMGRSREAIECFRRALELRPEYHPAFSNLLFALNYLPDTDRAELFAEHRRFDDTYGKPLRSSIEPHTNAPAADRTLRVGFVSGDLRDHPVASFIEPVFARYRREEWEVFCYANQTNDDAVTARLRAAVDHWRSVASLDDAELATAIRHDRIDILVDLSGHTARNRLLVFAQKPAPVQVSMIGYMQTTGLSAMDYRVTDAGLDPVGGSEAFSVEQLIRLPAGAAPFQPPPNCPEVNALPAATNGHVTFGSFNNLAKVTPEVLATWAEVLKAVPDSKLLVVGREGNTVRATFAAHGIDESRVEIIPRQPMADYLALHHRVDLLLDTFPYSGGTTALIAAWMGVPFVTLASEATTGRTGASLLRPLGLAQLIAANPAEYVQRAAVAASDLTRLAQWRGSLRHRLEPLLGGGEAYTHQLQHAFREIWRKWCASQS